MEDVCSFFMSKEPTQEQKNKRYNEFIKWLSDFKKQYSVNYVLEIEKISEILNEWYWNRISSHIKPFMLLGEDKGGDSINIEGEKIYIHHSKVISGIELTIMSCRPIIYIEDKLLNEKDRSEINAQLAWYISLSFLYDWKAMNDENIWDNIFVKDSEPYKFQREHLVWLEIFDPEFDYPIISNAQTIRLFSHIVDIYVGRI